MPNEFSRPWTVGRLSGGARSLGLKRRYKQQMKHARMGRTCAQAMLLSLMNAYTWCYAHAAVLSVVSLMLSFYPCRMYTPTDLMALYEEQSAAGFSVGSTPAGPFLEAGHGCRPLPYGPRLRVADLVITCTLPHVLRWFVPLHITLSNFTLYRTVPSACFLGAPLACIHPRDVGIGVTSSSNVEMSLSCKGT